MGAVLWFLAGALFGAGGVLFIAPWALRTLESRAARRRFKKLQEG